jgi:hypothetical protein
LLVAAGAAITVAPLRPISLAIAAAFGAAAFLRLVGAARPAVLAVVLCIVPPGVLGETSSRTALAALAVAGVCLVTAPRERETGDHLLVVLLGLAGVAYVASAQTDHLHSFTPIGLIYIGVAAVAWQMSLRPELTLRAVRAVALLAAAECASYWISLVLNFSVGPHTEWLKQRHIDIYLPVTLTGGSGGYWPSLPRLTVFAGEAGLGAVLLLVALACTLLHEDGRRRTVMAALLGSGLVFTQSSGALLALAVFAVIAMSTRISRNLTVLPAAAVAAACAVGLSRIATGLVHLKLATNAVSVTQRGLVGTGAFTGDISLHAAITHHPLVAVPVVLLFGCFAVRWIREPLKIGLLGAVAVIAWYAQPLQDHPGVWLLVAAAGGVWAQRGTSLTTR